ncbi:hypothetical protein N7519_002576 [Penicillium mononematosum]|uniref:uncharacterized protein n=1 Tax=Penicillium mononematosum TaxID=268346 RepID=UPI0025496EB2|nr:uncharacterized protein N7519_002576 [Penicillium mononematosum]KAJ6187668.1 hypothetical protein N7519_002576 [Penicillium mononematosum]
MMYQINCNAFTNFWSVPDILIYGSAAAFPYMLYRHPYSVHLIYFRALTRYRITYCMNMTISLLKPCSAPFLHQQSHVMFQAMYLVGSSCLYTSTLEAIPITNQ